MFEVQMKETSAALSSLKKEFNALKQSLTAQHKKYNEDINDL